MSERLELTSFPLTGTRLIEASAGTGKTFTISALVLRLLLGDDPQCEPLNIEQILVVTFTEAATAELRGRIRSRIHQARLDFLRGHSEDFLTRHLIEQTENHIAAAERLLQAEQNMDQAAVFTIHGFCQRMLKEHAFESGIAFESEFLTSESTLRLRAVEDCWRAQFYPLPKSLTARVMSFWSEPKALLRSLQSVLSQPQLKLSGITTDVDPIDWFTERLKQITQFKLRWQTEFEGLWEALESADLDKRSYSKRNLPKWLDEIHQFVSEPTENEQLPKNIARFGSQLLSEKTKTGPAPQHPLIAAVDQLLEDEVDLKALLLQSLIVQIRERFAQLKLQLQQLGFDDLLTILADALTHDTQRVLAQHIQGRYPVAMIDEFQDTDPQQYRIFSTIYAFDEQIRSGLFLIGDPKQAIYGFRGADIFTYMQARKQVQAHYTLPTNYRSSGAMIHAVNQLFEFHENPFIYRDAIEFIAVDSAERHSQSQGLLIDGKPTAALSFRLADNGAATLNSQDYQQLQARDCSAQIHRWLHVGQLDEGSQGIRAVQAKDIAVLVRTNREGQLIAQALDKLSIAYVLRANRDSVFASDEGYQLYLQMAAALNPNDERMLRAALAVPLMGYEITQLEELNLDELRWQQCVDEYLNYQRIWQRRGILPMLYRWLEQRDIAARILTERAGERQLTNLLHLGELLQSQAQQLDSPAALLRWFAQQLLNPESGADETQIRLESDAKRVQIVTIHKSKGLEYPIVLLPFMLSYRSAKEAIYHANGTLTYALDGNDEAKQSADQERLAEDLRLLYVALTRAKYHCSVGVGALSARANKKGTTSIENSALGFILQHGEQGTKASLVAALDALSQGSEDIDYEAAIDHWPEPFSEAYEATDELMARPLNRQVRSDWWLTSYSALSSHHGQWDASTELAWLDKTVVEDDEHVPEDILDVFHFARGPQAGTFLHSVFELIDFQATDEAVEQLLLPLMARAGYDEKWLDVIKRLRANVLHAPLNDDGTQRPFSLGQVEASQRLAEMEFVMPLGQLQARQLNQTLSRYDALSQQAQPLRFEQIQGMLKGFIDLVFCVEGRYYVLDYKSNYLGDSASDYNRTAMEQAMIEHRYDFQYQIYALALHRFLTQRIENYTYQHHFGGVYYIFMRGVVAQASEQTGVYFARPTEAFLDALDALFQGESA
ncbi:exodeoxyribonuclease V subunit beta [Celerinatantimonas diazotrophica]|uniref:RecBCD enzyme subunit RecB n=1 Tax=Celerinatantimonas diazotrophica TaxID=412034 RepID=A0A4R1K1S4_9GAMM|nr:exodeoxyribonuclease V subunit beta [Celerinatantimonas diazotrophica]TCK57613.1 DNA helicase/exodeoxyribonuclease V beta subunit [Celerinatantimonas diazotrophica]CAG9298325.1 RecBCD enzyme subunit RecB [Celerinatantimonas diazotrophica]